MLCVLLETRIDNPSLFNKKLVAAYVLGYWVALDKFSRSFFRSLTLCQTALQTDVSLVMTVTAKAGTSEGKGTSLVYFWSGSLILMKMATNKERLCYL